MKLQLDDLQKQMHSIAGRKKKSLFFFFNKLKMNEEQ